MVFCFDKFEQIKIFACGIACELMFCRNYSFDFYENFNFYIMQLGLKISNKSN